MKLASPEGAGDTVNDPSSDEEADPEDPTVAWCPPIPDAAEPAAFGSSPSRFKQLVATLTSSGGECQLQV